MGCSEIGKGLWCSEDGEEAGVFRGWGRGYLLGARHYLFRAKRIKNTKALRFLHVLKKKDFLLWPTEVLFWYIISISHTKSLQVLHIFLKAGIVNYILFGLDNFRLDNTGKVIKLCDDNYPIINLLFRNSNIPIPRSVTCFSPIS